MNDTRTDLIYTVLQDLSERFNKGIITKTPLTISYTDSVNCKTESEFIDLIVFQFENQVLGWPIPDCISVRDVRCLDNESVFEAEIISYHSN